MGKIVVDVNESKLSNYITLELFLPAIKFCIVQSIPGLAAYNSIANMVLGVFFALLFLLNIQIIIMRSGEYVLLTVITIIFLFISALLCGEPNFSNFTNAFVDIAIISCTLFLTTISIKNYNVLFDTLLKWSPFVVAAAIFMLVCTSIIGVVGTAQTNYNMSLSYYVVTPSCILFLGFLQKKRIGYLLLFLATIVVILAMGSRGPMLCIGLFILLFTIKTMRLTARNIIFLFLGVFAAAIVYVRFNDIVTKLYQCLLSNNIDSRTLYKIIQGSIFDDSNRSYIIEKSIETIRENFFGIGFMGDLSTHNIIIENILWFGVIVGTFINVALLVFIIRTLLIKIRLTDKRSLLILTFFCYAIPDSLLNLTVWGKDMFWIYFALMLTLQKPKKSESYGKESL